MTPHVLIPAYRPDHRLLELIRGLRAVGLTQIIVVDDGSTTAFSPVFEEILASNEARVVRHATNQGKGRALKTGMNEYLLSAPSGSPGVITVDADGQHLPQDVAKVALALQRCPNRLHLGARAFDHAVPLRSMFGNQLTKAILWSLTGLWLRDTQTGLRGIPRQMIPEFMKVAGERYEFEIGMLLQARKGQIPLQEHTIHTVYIDGNRGSHFNPLLDSMRIYFVLARFALSSIITSLVDLAVFSIVVTSGGTLGAAIVSARAVASIFNFTVNLHWVFQSRGAIILYLVKYYTLVAAMGVLTYWLIRSWHTATGVNWIAAKIVVESVLFVASFAIQREFVFRRRPLQPPDTGHVDVDEQEQLEPGTAVPGSAQPRS